MNIKEELIKLLDNSYSPHSKFRVSAIIKMNDGTYFKGVNVENASYGAAICVERNAILNAITNGYSKNDFKELHVMCGDSKDYSMPCFVCRQVISEFFDKDAIIYVYNNIGDYKEYKVSEACPYPFTSEDLK